MEVIITVHGTGDNSTSVELPRWWEPESVFSRQLQEKLDLKGRVVRIQPYVWSGANSERARQRAGAHLAKMVFTLEKNGTSYHLLGHSHGGSVIEAALVNAITLRRRKLPGLKSITTVGTPFLHVDRKRLSLKQVLETCIKPWWWLLVSFLAAGALLAIARSDKQWSGQEMWFSLFLGISPTIGIEFGAVWISIMIMVALPRIILTPFLPTRRPNLRNAKLIRAATAGRRNHIWHPEDEAISSLSAVQNVKFSLFRRSKLSAVLSAPAPWLLFSATITLFIVSMFTSTALYPELLNLVTSPNEFPHRFVYMSIIWVARASGISQSNMNSVPEIDTIIKLSFIARLFFIITIFVLLLGIISRTFDWIYQHSIGRGLDRLVASQVRTIAFGSDIRSLAIRGASPTPWYVHDSHLPLAPDVIAQIDEIVEAGASDTLRKLRKDLGASLYSREGFDLVTSVSDRVSWRELVHTSYFLSQRFVDVIAACVVKNPEPIHEKSEWRDTEGIRAYFRNTLGVDWAQETGRHRGG